jgi:hypothetical protein
MPFTPLLRKRLLSLIQRKRVVPCVCRLDSEPPDARYAIREITINSSNAVVGISGQTLSPKSASRADLAVVIRELIERSASGPVRCGEPERSFGREELESWLVCTSEPVFQIIEK